VSTKSLVFITALNIDVGRAVFVEKVSEEKGVYTEFLKRWE